MSLDRRRPRRHGAAATDKRRRLFDLAHAGEGAGGPDLELRPIEDDANCQLEAGGAVAG